MGWTCGSDTRNILLRNPRKRSFRRQLKVKRDVKLDFKQIGVCNVD